MRILVLDASPEELEQAPAWLREVLSEAGAVESASPTANGPELDASVMEWFEGRMPNANDQRRVRSLRFLRAVQGLGPDVRIRPGNREDGEGSRAYLWAKRGSSRAMFYFRPLSLVVDFGLPDEVAEGRAHVQLHQNRRAYRLRVEIVDEEPLETAIELARISYDAS